MNKQARKFRDLIINSDRLVLRPCAYDALSALLIEDAGFGVIGTSGYGISATLIGKPDIGLLGFSEIFERARTIINAVDTPVDVDIDTGYGNAMNVYWTVSNMIKIGAAGIRFEDQDWPKRCGHMEGKSIIARDEMISKIKAAILAREEMNSDLVIGARTDVRSVYGFQETLNRAIAYAEAGVDYIYVEAPQSIEEIKTLVNQVSAPIALNIVPGGKTPPFSIEELEEIGVRYLSVPMICLYPAIKAMQNSLHELANGRSLDKIIAMGIDWEESNNIVGFNEWKFREQLIMHDKI